MKKVEYSQLVKRKLLKIKKEILLDYGEQKAKEILTSITVLESVEISHSGSVKFSQF